MLSYFFSVYLSFYEKVIVISKCINLELIMMNSGYYNKFIKLNSKRNHFIYTHIFFKVLKSKRNECVF